MLILLAEDSRYQRALVREQLERWGHSVVSAETGDQALEILTEANGPRLAILDWEMPGKTGPELCRLVRSQGGDYIYIILLTARDGHDEIADGLTAGADDFMSKPANMVELRARIHVAERILGVHDELRQAREQLHFDATHDVLTGVWNRRAILKFLDSELSRCLRVSISAAVLMIDIDHFKKINDTYGHAVGDRVLTQISTRCIEVMRPYDVFGRYGGEEFLALLPGADLEGAAEVAQRVRLQAKRICLGEYPSLGLSLSIGAAAYVPGYSANELIDAADQALYRAKSAGRDRVELAASAMCLST